jgi:hypothetical protein
MGRLKVWLPSSVNPCIFFYQEFFKNYSLEGYATSPRSYGFPSQFIIKSSLLFCGSGTCNCYRLVYALSSQCQVITRSTYFRSKKVSFMPGIPGISHIWSLFSGAKAIGQGAVSVVSIGSAIARYNSVEDLAQELKRVEARPGSINTLIIYGNNLELIEDPGILALKPMKLILVGITIKTDASDTSLDSLMYVEGWYVDPADTDASREITVIKVASLQQAVEAELRIDPITNMPMPTVFIVQVPVSL